MVLDEVLVRAHAKESLVGASVGDSDAAGVVGRAGQGLPIGISQRVVKFDGVILVWARCEGQPQGAVGFAGLRKAGDVE